MQQRSVVTLANRTLSNQRREPPFSPFSAQIVPATPLTTTCPLTALFLLPSGHPWYADTSTTAATRHRTQVPAVTLSCCRRGQKLRSACTGGHATCHHPSSSPPPSDDSGGPMPSAPRRPSSRHADDTCSSPHPHAAARGTTHSLPPTSPTPSFTTPSYHGSAPRCGAEAFLEPAGLGMARRPARHETTGLLARGQSTTESRAQRALMICEPRRHPGECLLRSMARSIRR